MPKSKRDLTARDIERIDEALALVREELLKASAGHAPMRGSHEGLGVIYEEFDEFADEVRANNAPAMKKEAKQLAAMATRFLVDCEMFEDGHNWQGAA